MATIWKGSIAFGLVNIPVELRTAIRADHISFRLLHQEDLSPLRYERVCQADGEPVPWNEIVKGYEYQKGKFVAAKRSSSSPRRNRGTRISST
jgi:DNA end-binding protein Ku